MEGRYKRLKGQILQNLSTVSPICSFYTKKLLQNSPGKRSGAVPSPVMQHHAVLIFLNLQYFKFSATFPFSQGTNIYT